MKASGKNMLIKNNQAYISRYEVMSAFFRTEEEDNESMANKLNELINMFCNAETQNKSNVTILPFDVNKYKSVIEYIGNNI